MDNKTNKYVFFKGISYMGFSQIVSIAFAVFFNYIFANSLNVSEYGVFNYILSLLILISGFSGAYAINSAIIRYISETRNKKLLKKFIRFELILIIPAFLIVFIFAEPIAFLLKKDIAFTLRLLSPIIILVPLYTSLKSVLNSFKEFKKSAVIEILFKIINFSSAVLLFFGVGLRISALVIASILSYLSGIFVAYIQIRKIKFRDDKYDISRIKKFINWNYLPTVLKRVYPSIFMMIYGALVSFKDIGYFSLASKAEIVMGVIRTVILNVYYPFISSFPNDNERLSKYSSGIFKLYFGLAILFTLLVLFFGMPVINLLFPQYLNSYWLAVILSASYIINLSIFDGLFLAKERTKEVNYLSITRAIVNIVGGFFSVYYFGVIGISFTYFLTATIPALLTIYYLRKIQVKINLTLSKEDIKIIKSIIRKVIKKH